MVIIAEEKTHIILVAVVAIVALSGLAFMFSADVQTQPTIVIVPVNSEISGLESEDLAGAITYSNRTASRR